jgi:hypothetical protein
MSNAETERDAPTKRNSGLDLCTLKRYARRTSMLNTEYWNNEGAQKVFTHPISPSAGEFIYETIFAAPVGSVVDKLRKYDSRRELWQDLPKAF